MLTFDGLVDVVRYILDDRVLIIIIFVFFFFLRAYADNIVVSPEIPAICRIRDSVTLAQRTAQQLRRWLVYWVAWVGLGGGCEVFDTETRNYLSNIDLIWLIYAGKFYLHILIKYRISYLLTCIVSFIIIVCIDFWMNLICILLGISEPHKTQL
ncbi:hypothetical protein ACJX0J_022495 [Zea mays]